MPGDEANLQVGKFFLKPVSLTSIKLLFRLRRTLYVSIMGDVISYAKRTFNNFEVSDPAILFNNNLCQTIKYQYEHTLSMDRH